MLIFVYGTLKKGFQNNHVISNGKLLGNHVTKSEFTMYDLGAYPSVCFDGSTAIHGEVWELPDLIRTDYLEGYPGYYDRVQIDTPFGDAWIYFLEACNEKVISSGRWDR